MKQPYISDYNEEHRKQAITQISRVQRKKGLGYTSCYKWRYSPENRKLTEARLEWRFHLLPPISCFPIYVPNISLVSMIIQVMKFSIIGCRFTFIFSLTLYNMHFTLESWPRWTGVSG